MQQIEDDEVVDFGFGFDFMVQFWVACDFVWEYNIEFISNLT
jgi:hypothetical protein